MQKHVNMLLFRIKLDPKTYEEALTNSDYQ